MASVSNDPTAEPAAIANRARESIRASTAPCADVAVAALAPAPAAQPRPDRTAASTLVRVRRGTTLSHLAVRYYGSASAEAMARIKAANPSLQGDRLRAGDTIRVPHPSAGQTAGKGRR
jgi:nucleoid-associated protein YgaU